MSILGQNDIFQKSRDSGTNFPKSRSDNFGDAVSISSLKWRRQGDLVIVYETFKRIFNNYIDTDDDCSWSDVPKPCPETSKVRLYDRFTGKII